MKPEDKTKVCVAAKKPVSIFKLKTRTLRGIYFLMQEGEICYIGQSIDIDSRIKDHKKTKSFDEVFYFLWDGDLVLIEAILIRQFKPRLNRQGSGDRPDFSGGRDIVGWKARQMAALENARVYIQECLRVHGCENSVARSKKWKPEFRLSSI